MSALLSHVYYKNKLKAFGSPKEFPFHSVLNQKKAHILFMNYHNSTLHKIKFQTSHTLQTVRDPFISATQLWEKTDFNTQIQQQQKEQSLLSWERTQTGKESNSKHWDLSTVKQFKDDPWWLICSL